MTLRSAVRSTALSLFLVFGLSGFAYAADEADESSPPTTGEETPPVDGAPPTDEGEEGSGDTPSE
jgi:hypothetical protein